MSVLGVDPGNRFSALVEWDGDKVLHASKVENRAALEIIQNSLACNVALEEIVPFRRFVGKEVTETALWTGRLQERAEVSGKNTHLYYRKTIVAALTGSAKGGDKEVRKALIDRFGPPPSKGNPNPVYNGFKIVDDLWQAWGVAVCWFCGHSIKIG